MNSSDKVILLLEESRAFERGGEIAAAIRCGQQARQLTQALDDSDGEADALNVLAYAHIRLGHYHQAQEFCRQALTLAGVDSHGRAEALLNLSICANETNDLNASEAYNLQAVDLGRQIGDDRILVRGLHSLSCGIYMPRGQFALSLAADEEAIHIARSRGFPEFAWGPLLTISWVYWLTGQRHLAEARLKELLQVISSGSLGDGYWHFIHASLALDAGEYETARDLFSKTFSIAESNGIAENLFFARIGLSRLSRTINDASAAFSWASEALSIGERIGYHHLQGIAYIERARGAWALGNLSAAKDDLHSAIHRLAPLRLDYDLALAELLLAALLRQQNQLNVDAIWQQSARRLAQGGFAYLAERERALAFPLIAAGLTSSDAPTAQASAILLEHLQRVSPAPLKIVTLGGLRVKVGGYVVDSQTLRQRRAGELLGLLLVSPGRSLSVEQVIDALWPEKEPAAAQVLFHHATSTLRRALEPDLPDKFPSFYLEVKEGKVNLRLPPPSTVDFETFEAHYRREEWAAALAWCGGEFLPEYRYADWSASRRQWLAQDIQRAELEMAKIWLAENEWFKALEACRKVLAIEPWQDQAVLLGMRACLGIGDRSGALRLYKSLEKILHDELGIQPPVELQELARTLRKP
ncbi:MAG: hypothetical protein CVU39_01245 [Chloroflexi bacterium HGW-Chloroflexi-10]|nr:MAG: hypothetical protein CVU39_01245 [Chloroflexi bacterium HGW-Chloroflexi-10]